MRTKHVRRDRERKLLALHLPRDILNLTMSYSQQFDGILCWREKNQANCQMLIQWNDNVVFFSRNRNNLLLFHLIDKSMVDEPNMAHPTHSWASPHFNHNIIVMNANIIFKLQDNGMITRIKIEGVIGLIWCFMEESKFLMSDGNNDTTSLYQIDNSQLTDTRIVKLQSWPFFARRAIALAQDRFACFVANKFQIWDLNEGLKVNIPFEFDPIDYQQLIFDAWKKQILIHVIRRTARRRSVYFVDNLIFYDVSTGKHNFKKPFQLRHIDNKIELGVGHSISQQVNIKKMQMGLDGILYLLVRRYGVKGSCLVTFDLVTKELKQYTTPSVTDFLILHDRRVLCQNKDSLFLLD